MVVIRSLRYYFPASRLSAGKTTLTDRATFVLPAQFWQDVGTSEHQPEAYLLFEGVGDGGAEAGGQGALEYVFLDAQGREISHTGALVYLDLRNVKSMYQRGKAQPDPDYPAPYNYDASHDPSPHPPVSCVVDPNGFPFERPFDETRQCIVYVHGFDTNYAAYESRAQTTFKRLWWRGYKGRFCAFRWPTLDALTVQSLNNLDANYNEGEYRAWKYGPALKAYVESLPNNYEKSIAAHSLGNVVVGSALKSGMTVDNYTLMNAAISAGCYDTSPALDYTDFVTEDQQHPTPDLAADLGYRGYLSGVRGVRGKFSNFYNPEDKILALWNTNNKDRKPVHYFTWPEYDYFPSEPSNARRKLTFFSTVGRLINDPEESMPFIARSRALAVGREGATAGPIQPLSGKNVNAPPYSFGDEHSAPWERSVQQLKAYYDDLLKSFKITPNDE